MNGFKEIGTYESAESYGNNMGNFAMATKVKDEVKRSTEFHSCRESFANHFQKNFDAPFVMAIDSSKNGKKGILIFEFIAQCEEMLGIQAPSEMGFFRNKTTLIFIKPSAWWIESELRRQFLTVLLRCSMTYDGTNFFKALYGSKYTETTRKAVDKFFDGFTGLSGPNMGGHNGWLANFGGDKNLDRLVKPSGKKAGILKRVAKAVTNRA